MQRYESFIAVYECFFEKNDFFLAPETWRRNQFGAVIWSFGHLSKSKTDAVKIRHYNINIFIYSEQITAFPISKMTK